MKGYRFYLESDSPKQKRRGEHMGNVIAVMLYKQHGQWRPVYETLPGEVLAFVAVLAHANSSVCSSAVSRDYLRRQCKRVPEAKAREVHPAMFEHIAYCEQMDREYAERHPEMNYG